MEESHGDNHFEIVRGTLRFVLPPKNGGIIPPIALLFVKFGCILEKS